MPQPPTAWRGGAWWLVCGVCLLAFCGGCTADPPQFHPNLIEMRLQEKAAGEPISAESRKQIADVLLALFGTPDDPDPFYDPRSKKPSLLETFGFNVRNLKIAAGRVYSEESGKQHGLFRLHCAHCHGLTGDGAGPTALFLNPYPRDYRPGKFKFKSTVGDEKPTREDLVRILQEGIPGTAMPTFRVLSENEREILAEYVEYLSIRGQTELRLIELVASGESIPEPAVLAGGFPLKVDADGNTVEPSKDNIVASLVQKWRRAPQTVIDPPAPAPKFENEKERLASVDRGRQLFYSNVAACFNCHGNSQLGDGQLDYASRFQWRKDLEQKPAAERDREIDELLALGALPPRQDKPRDLRMGVYRGGRRPLDIYRRIYSGINGTPMPKISVVPAGPDGKPVDPNKGVTAGDIWNLVNYVKSLPYEPLSQAPKPRTLDLPGEHQLQ